MTPNSGVYKITNTFNGNFYIGSSADIRKRFGKHRSALVGNRHCNAHLQNAWNKYGADSFSFETILLCDESMTVSCEQELLEQLSPAYNIALDATAPMKGRTASAKTCAKMSAALTGERNPRFGKPGTMLGRKHADEQKRKNSEAQMGKTLTYEHKQRISAGGKGKHHRTVSPESRAKMSAAKMGKTFSPEACANMSAARMGHTVSPEARANMSAAQAGENHPMFGKHHSEETKLLMSEAHKRRREAAKRELIATSEQK